MLQTGRHGPLEHAVPPGTVFGLHQPKVSLRPSTSYHNGMSDHFSEKSKNWDQRPVPLQIAQALGKLLPQRLTLRPEMEVMDFGAGTGLVAAHVAPHVAQVVAVDVSASMLEVLSQKPELQGKVETRCQDILTTPLPETFDAIVSAMALHHVENLEGALGAFHAHLKEGGVLALADLDIEDGSFHPPETVGVFHQGFEREALRTKLQAAGFSSIHFETAVEVERESGRKYPVFFLTAHRRGTPRA